MLHSLLEKERNMNKKSLSKKNNVSASSEDRYMKAIRKDAARSVSVYLVFIVIFLSAATIIAICCGACKSDPPKGQMCT